MENKIRSIAMLTGVFALFEASSWAQCVMCGTALASSPEGQALASSFRYGIGVLMFSPYLIIGSIGYAIFRAYRKGMRLETGDIKKIPLPTGGRAAASASPLGRSHQVNAG